MVTISGNIAVVLYGTIEPACIARLALSSHGVTADTRSVDPIPAAGVFTGHAARIAVTSGSLNTVSSLAFRINTHSSAAALEPARIARLALASHGVTADTRSVDPIPAAGVFTEHAARIAVTSGSLNAVSSLAAGEDPRTSSRILS
jgi:predicted methyltransferase